MNHDTGDGKDFVTSTDVMQLDGFNRILNMNGGAVFNTSSGNFDFQVKGLTNSNLLFVQGSTDRIGVAPMRRAPLWTWQAP